MPIVQAIQLKLSLQTTGEEAVKRFMQQIQELAKMPVKINLESQFQTSAQSLTTAIEKQMPKIQQMITDGVEAAMNRVVSKVTNAFGEIETKLEKSKKNIRNMAIGDNIATMVTRGIVLAGVQLKLLSANATSFIKAVSTVFSQAKFQLIEKYVVHIGPMLSSAFKKMKDVLFVGEQLWAGLVKGDSLLKIAYGTFSTLAAGISGLLTTSGYFLFSGMFFREATNFFQRMLGFQTKITLLDRVSNIVTTIDTSLHTSYITMGSLLKVLGFGVASLLGAWTSFFSPFFGVVTHIAFVNTIVTEISKKLERGKLKTAAFFGNGVAQIKLAFLYLRDIFLQIANSLPNFEKPLKAALKILPQLIQSWAEYQQKQQKVIQGNAKIAKQYPSKPPPISPINWADVYQKTRTQQAKNLLPLPNVAQQTTTTLQQTIQRSSDVIRDSAQKVAIACIGLRQALLLPTRQILALPAPIAIKPTTATTTMSSKAIPDLSKKAPLLPDLRVETENIRKEMLALLLRLKMMGMSSEALADIFRKMQAVAVVQIGRMAQSPVNRGQVNSWTRQSEQIPAKYMTGANLRVISAALETQIKQALGTISEGRFLRYALGIPKEIARGIQADPTILAKATDKALQVIKDSVPSSPAKRGPLRFLRASGKSILTELAIGMNSNLNVAQTAVTKVAKAIARFFPHSPAEEGPLRGLRQWGQGILSQLSLGISDKLTSLLGMFFNLANQIKATIKPILEMSFIGERMGVNVQTVSLLEYAFAGFEVQASEVQMTMQSLNRTLAEVATPEKLAALAQVGINLQQVRQAANPTMEMFYQLSDALQRFPMSSDKMIKAMEALGVSTQSNLINALAQGREQIQASMNEGVKMGAAYDESFVKAGHSFTELMNKIGKIGEILEREFALTLMPVVDGLFRKIFNFYQENASEIRAVVRVAGQAIGILIETISKVVAQAWQNPAAFKDAIIGILSWLYQSAGTLWNAFLEDSMSGITSHVWLFLKHTVVAAVKAGWNLFIQLGELAWNSVILFGMSKIESIVKTLAESLSGSIGGSYIAKEIETAFAPLRQITEDAKKSSTFSFEDTIMKVAEENGKILEEARKQVAQDWTNIQDPEAIKRTTERFSQAFNKITSRFQGSLQGTGFDKILSESFEKLNEALSKGNFGEALGVLEDVNQKMQRLNEGIVEVGKNAVEGANKAGDAAKNAVDGFKNGLQTAERETKNLTDKIQSMLLDMRIRVATTEDQRNKAQEQKDMLDLQTKHSQELVEFEKLLHAKYLLDEQYAKLSFEEQAKYIKDLDEYKEFIEAQGIEKPKVVDKNDQKDQQEFYQNWSGTFDNLGSAFGNMYELMGEKAKAFFFMQKGIAIAQAIVNTAEGITKALATEGIMGTIMAGSIAAAGAAQVAVITAQAIQGPTAMATGGTVPGTGDKDTVSIMATPGEFILPKQATSLLASKYGASFLEGLRQGVINLSNSLPSPKPVPSYAFATGGPVSMLNSQQPQSQAPINIVNIVDPNDFERYLGSARGQKMVLNVLRRNNREVQRFNKG